MLGNIIFISKKCWWHKYFLNRFIRYKLSEKLFKNALNSIILYVMYRVAALIIVMNLIFLNSQWEILIKNLHTHQTIYMHGITQMISAILIILLCQKIHMFDDYNSYSINDSHRTWGGWKCKISFPGKSGLKKRLRPIKINLFPL